jgi:hypothetical protein
MNIGSLMKNNIFALNGGWGMNNTGTAFANDDNYDGNFYGTSGQSNTSGTRNGFGTGATDVTFTGDPFTDKAGGDWSLNNTSNAGASIRGASSPSSIVGSSTDNYRDGGAVQHQDSGGGGMLYIQNMSGV